MNIIDICQIMYPGEIELGNITFRMPEDEILIGTWNVAGVPQPTEAELLALIPTYEHQFDTNQLMDLAIVVLNQAFERVAIERGYKSSLDCISYYSSSSTQKSQDARTFITWRDSLWIIYVTVITDFENGVITKPTEQEFILMCPNIIWV